MDANKLRMMSIKQCRQIDLADLLGAFNVFRKHYHLAPLKRVPNHESFIQMRDAVLSENLIEFCETFDLDPAKVRARLRKLGHDRDLSSATIILSEFQVIPR